MPYEKLDIKGARVPILSWCHHPLSSDETSMLRNVSRLPCVFHHVSLMSDGHLGKGSMVGSVVATKEAIVPAMVGVDLACGMMAIKTPFKSGVLDDKLSELRAEIEKNIPVGFNEYSRSDLEKRDWDGFNQFETLHAGVQDRKVKAMNQLGTLGGGNHFIEVCLDTEDNVWLMLHSGSRNIGKELAERHIATAKTLHRLNELPDPDLAYFIKGTAEFKAYWKDLAWAQAYALKNREVMMKRLLKVFNKMINNGVAFRPEISVNCLAGETPVLMKDGTSVPIKFLTGKHHWLLTEGGNWVFAPIKSFGKQKLFEITLSRSGTLKTIRATANHRWLLENVQRVSSECITTQLKKGNRLASTFPNKSNNLTINKEGVQRGFIFGDGSSNGNKSYANFCGAKDDNLMKFFEGCRLPKDYTSHKRITGFLLNWKTELPSLDEPVSVLYSWLAGYFAADGDVDKTGRPSLSSAIKSNLEYVRQVCTTLGIGTFGIRSYLRQGFGNEKSLIHVIGLMRNDLLENFFLIPEHKIRFTNRIAVAERRRWTVLSVVETNIEEEVFCAVVPKTHSFVLEDNILTGNCHHNYVSEEKHFDENVYITRKGAVNAAEGVMGIIPGSMGAKSFIVRGKGNADSFNSCSHGAGRRMSRGQAKRTYTLEDLAEQTKGVECRKDKSIIDEIPKSYKDIVTVMKNQEDLVEIVAEIKQCLCVKG